MVLEGGSRSLATPGFAATLLESAPDIVIAVKADATICYANRRALEWTGPELLGSSMLRHIVPRYYRMALRNFQRNLEGQRTTPYEIEIVNRRGQTKWVEVHAAPHQADGEEAAVVAVLRDTTSRHAHVERLRLLGQTVMSVHEAVAISDARGRLTFVNPAFVRMLAYSPAEALGLRFATLLSPANPPRLTARMFHATREGRWEGELILTRKGGEEFPAHLTTCLVRDEKGVGVASVGICRDVTRQKMDAARIAEMNVELQVMNARLEQQNEELKTLNAFRSDMLALVAHDLKTPLSSIYGYTRLLLGGGIPPEQSHRTLNRIVDLVGNTTALVGGLLDYRRLEDEPHRLEIVPVPARPAVERAIDATVHGPGPHRVRVEGEFATVLSHENLLFQILSNLLSNAVKYSPDGGDITVRGRVIEDFQEISVTDRGLGIPEEMLHTLFESYERLDRPAIRHISGSGLGLNLVRTFVQIQGGRIWATSREGQGSTFTFTVPLYQPTPAPCRD